MISEGMEGLLGEYVLDATERMTNVEQLLLSVDELVDADRASCLDRLKAELHTLKGNSGMMGFTELQEIAHAMEDHVAELGQRRIDVSLLLEALDEFRNAFQAHTKVESPESLDGDREQVIQGSVRVPFTALDSLVAQLAEIVIVRNGLYDVIESGDGLDPTGDEYLTQSKRAWGELHSAYDSLRRTLDIMQNSILQLRMVSLGTLFGSLKRIVHDETAKTGKEVSLQTSGGDTPLDKALLELANEVLGHLVRNAVVHGLESPDVRESSGKPREGIVRVDAAARGDEVWIDVSDDGGGIDWESLRRSAATKGVDLESVADEQAIIFHPGVSAKGDADMSAGRGVGLSAVLDAVRRQGGEIDVSSKNGQGTAFRIRLPLNVSIARVLLISVDDEIYALPLVNVVESRRLQAGDGHELNHAGVLQWRDSVISLLDLGHHFETASTIRDQGYVVVIEANGKYRGLVTDEIRGIQDVVVRMLDPTVGKPPGVAGSTVLGDGRPILILDARRLADIEPFVKEAA
jgi:two-component system chemotaxis sensor kinase CheA